MKQDNYDTPEFVVVRPSRSIPSSSPPVKGAWPAPEDGQAVYIDEDELEDGDVADDEGEDLGQDSLQAEEGADEDSTENLHYAVVEDFVLEASTAQPATDASSSGLVDSYTTGTTPPETWGPVKVSDIAGKGRAVVAERDIKPGELLMVASPLFVMTSPAGSTPENEELAAAMWQQAVFTQQQLAALGSLSDGSSPSGTQPPETSPAAAEAPSSAPAGIQGGPAGSSPQPADGSATTLGGAEDRMPGSASGLDKQRFFRAVAANCLGEEFQDVVTTKLGGSISQGFLGVWPEAAMLNHSCCPNACAWALGDRMTVRAATRIRSGEEVCITYLGQGLMRPLAQRRAELQEVYGFQCGCKRCELESRQQGKPLGRLMGDLSVQLAPLLQQLETEGGGQLQAVQGQLLELRTRLEAALKAAKIKDATHRRWLQASLYQLYDAISVTRDETQQEVETESLAECVRIIEAVSPGSDSLLDLGAELLSRTLQRFGPSHDETKDALRRCRAAMLAHYGPLPPDLEALLVRLRLEPASEEAAPV